MLDPSLSKNKFKTVLGRKLREIILRHRKSGYTITITPYKEDSEYWYVTENLNGDISNTLWYSKVDFDLMGER
jgi:hypothetical protein